MKPEMTQELDYEAELALVIGNMWWDVPEEKAYDIISTGTPEGIANGRKGADCFLKEKGLLESEIEEVGCLRNKIVDGLVHEKSWTW